MLVLGPIAFAAPWVLTALAVLPVLWLILRAVPPAPRRRRFPGVMLLLGLRDDETQSDRTPWWLLLLRMLAVAAVILAFAGPILNPRTAAEPGRGPLLILLDGTWADARDWAARIDRVEAALGEASRTARPVSIAVTTDLPAGGAEFQAADAWRSRLASLAPAPWAADPDTLAGWTRAQPDGFDTLWLSDGLAREGRDDALAALQDKGRVRIFESPRAVLALRPPVYLDGLIEITALRARESGALQVPVAAMGLDPTGAERMLAQTEASFAPGARQAELSLSLPAELRNRITRFEITGGRSAGAVSLTDDALRRREIALIAGREDREGLQLLSPLHYLEQALEPNADLIDGDIADILQANPDVIVLADVARLTGAETEDIADWIDRGGLLLRFAGPRLAAADLTDDAAAVLLPVRLRAGGRTVGGAMSWGEPKALRPFPETSPFYGLDIPAEVTVTSQVLAQPDPDLPERVIAALADGTPLVTRQRLGAGQIVLFHVTANAEWSTLPLSGLFVQMLERLSVAARVGTETAEDLAGTTWQAVEHLDAFGVLAPAGMSEGLDGSTLLASSVGPALPPGLYASEDQRRAVNVIGAETELAPMVWPAGVPVEGLEVARETRLAGPLLVLALGLMVADVVASLLLSGLLGLRRTGTAMVLLAGLLLSGPGPLHAQDADLLPVDEAAAIQAISEVVLAHVITGNPAVDDTARAGLHGLSRTLFARTSVEPGPPVAVDLETDELAFFPVLYWPVTPDQPRPSSEAYARLNRYLRGGGMILFDTRDADLAAMGSETANTRKLQDLARPLDIPPLEPVPEDHVLTRTFYLLQDFPGRHARGPLWVEAAPPDAERVEGMPFRNLNDGVTPVVIGSNDWAAAWAMDGQGRPMFPVGRGYAGERQREMAYRFGINLVMHVLTGNYKSDQVHVPALLDRLGQ
ncbi:DUF4159 domain-containing protein [Meridianimarinicoccus sp. MJW13]|uniref:DUF4159 domain-containing protein n=1 Tax=Meridianimarinicoccus sp. MJW13 TaxID=2720031 RepID=UPI0018668F6A|nr:DUF4159 domain-containing protein [Fluviibacterium sp. MJW13]